MKLLAWDTSSKTGAIAALEWDPAASSVLGAESGPKLLAELNLGVEATHSERLLWGIHQVLESARWKIADVDVFGVGVGPGSFTGLRIGITTARSLSMALGKPVVGVSSLAALLRPAALWFKASGEKVLLVASTDAAKGELFACYGAAASVADCVSMADGDHAGLWKRGVIEGVFEPAELGKSLVSTLKKKGSPTQWMALGEGRNRYPDFWKTLPSQKEIQNPILGGMHIQGRFVAQLAWEGYQAGLARSASEIKPRYLRSSDAEVKLKAGVIQAYKPRETNKTSGGAS